MRKTGYGFVRLMAMVILTPIPVAIAKDVPVIAAPDTPEKCRSTGKTGACPEIPTHHLPAGHADSKPADCSIWTADSLADYAQTADRALNRDRQGRPILYGLTEATWLIRQERWSDAAYDLIGFDHSFWLIPGRGGERVPAVVGRITTVLHHCLLGPDYSMRPMPALQMKRHNFSG